MQACEASTTCDDSNHNRASTKLKRMVVAPGEEGQPALGHEAEGHDEEDDEAGHAEGPGSVHLCHSKIGEGGLGGGSGSYLSLQHSR